ncbi:MAG: hypothetical protein DRJ65_08340 [Acidobacteria bacterium]|nr:MAG: hypothetical protein DRJ65_08340 [Acidobacteriota bacterium]
MVVDSLDPTAFSEADREFLRRIYNMESLKNMAHEDANYIGGADQRRDAWEELSKMGYLEP